MGGSIIYKGNRILEILVIVAKQELIRYVGFII